MLGALASTTDPTASEVFIDRFMAFYLIHGGTPKREIAPVIEHAIDSFMHTRDGKLFSHILNFYRYKHTPL
jgi:hypothetical protein